MPSPGSDDTITQTRLHENSETFWIIQRFLYAFFLLFVQSLSLFVTKNRRLSQRFAFTSVNSYNKYQKTSELRGFPSAFSPVHSCFTL